MFTDNYPFTHHEMFIHHYMSTQYEMFTHYITGNVSVEEENHWYKNIQRHTSDMT